jgi:UDP-3-O-[3-hydroxymyristoyl] N-acetylglucosamine deacetylase/3-hydroxyacyl-[acyl-carrier-protein] dehydratase
VGCDLDNVIIELNTSELPIMDCLNILLKLLKRPELKNKIQNGIFTWLKKLSLLLMRKVGEILIMPNDSYCVTTDGRFGTKILGTQNATMGIYEFKRNL